MMETPATRNSLFTPAERNEFLTKESRLIFNAKNGDVKPIVNFWIDKLSLMRHRADERGLIARQL